MKFKAVNELNNFGFEDCQVFKADVTGECISLEVEALIVKPANSQNTNFTESYAGTTQIRFVGGEILSAFKEGYKYYNADDVLLKEEPDVPLNDQEIAQILKNISGAYLFSVAMEKQENDRFFYSLGIEFVSEEEYNTSSDSYIFNIVFDKAIVEWDRYMNRVQG